MKILNRILSFTKYNYLIIAFAGFIIMDVLLINMTKGIAKSTNIMNLIGHTALFIIILKVDSDMFDRKTMYREISLTNDLERLAIKKIEEEIKILTIISRENQVIIDSQRQILYKLNQKDKSIDIGDKKT